MEGMKIAKNGVFLQLVYILQRFTRWSEYAPKFKDNYASHSFRSALLGEFACMVEQGLFNNKIDMEKVMCRLLFHNLTVTKRGSIKHKTKHNEMVKHHIEELNLEKGKEIVAYLSESIQPSFYDYIVNAEDDTLEGKMVDAMGKFDAMLFCKREVEFGSNYVFKDKYEELSNKLRNHDLPSVRWMMEQVDEEGDFYNFLFSILMLDRVERWTGNHNSVEDEDSVHLYRTSALYVWLTLISKYEVSDDRADELHMVTGLSKVLVHDVPEEWTGDVLGPVKHSTPERKKAFEVYEQKVAIKMGEQLPEVLRKGITDHMVNAKSDDYNGMMVNMCDKLDALLKCNIERRTNGWHYEIKYREELMKAQARFGKVPAVMFFLAFPLHDFDNQMLMKMI